MKYKILIIFLFSLIISYTIYYGNYKNSLKIISIGDSLSLGINQFNEKDKNYNDFLVNYYSKKNIDIIVNNYFSKEEYSYKQLLSDIKSNSKIVIRNKDLYLNQEIAKSNIMLIALNNSENFIKCKSSFKNYINYLDRKKVTIEEIAFLINRISRLRIVILGNYCTDYNKEISDYIDKIFDSEDYLYINLYKLMHDGSNLLPNVNNSYPSIDGHYMIYEKIVKMLK